MNDTERRQLGMEELFRNSGYSASTRAPGNYLFWYLGQLIDPAEVLYSDWSVSTEDGEGPSGTAFFIARGEVVRVTFKDVPEEKIDLNEAPHPAALTVSITPINEIGRVHITVDHLSPERPNTQPKCITIASETWEVNLPSTPIYKVKPWEYFNKLRDALAQSAASS